MSEQKKSKSFKVKLPDKKQKNVKFQLPSPPDFEEGVLCFALLRRYKGKGPIRLLLHEATPTSNGFGYGAGRCWITSKPKLPA